MGVPLNQPFRWNFHKINHPAIKGYPHDFGNPHMKTLQFLEEPETSTCKVMFVGQK